MGLSSTLVVFPLLVLTLCVILSGAGGFQTATGSSSAVCLPATSVSCTADSQGNLTYSCLSPSNPNCVLPYDCPSGAPAPSYCLGTQWVINNGLSVIIPSALISTLIPLAQSAGFSALSSAGFIVMIGITTGIVVLGAIDFFGTGENSEGIHIAWMTTLLLGIWGILSVADGFLLNSPNSFFIQLNGFFPDVGTTLYIFLTLLFTMGTIGSISRGSGAGGGV